MLRTADGIWDFWLSSQAATYLLLLLLLLFI